MAVLIPVALVILVVFIFAWRRIKAQSKALRILTEAEIRTFVQGNPDFKLDADGYLDQGYSIDALPYDQTAFEIPLENLQIGDCLEYIDSRLFIFYLINNTIQ